MKPLAHFAAMLTGLVLLLTITPSWGASPVCVAPGCNPTVSDANSNTAGGVDALFNVVSGPSGGFSNTAFGDGALAINTTGSNNTASGAQALVNNTTGSDNTATGFFALYHNTGDQNTATGTGALFANNEGFNNTASGAQALLVNITGNNNTATGFQSLEFNAVGADNTAVGAKALKKSLGTKNIGIGYQAGVTLTNGNNNIFIGNVGAGDESQTIRIGTAQVQTFIAGIANATVSGATVEVDAVTGQLGVMTSSARYKQDITPMGTSSEKVLNLRPVTFAYKNEAAAVTHYGLIAEEVAAVYPELVTRTPQGDVQAVRYQELIPMLLNELQHEHHEVTILRQELAELRALVGSRQGQ
jgi:hypothetical protein